MTERPDLLPVVYCLGSFAGVKDSVFGSSLDERAGEKIEQFKNSFLDLQTYMKNSFGVDLTVTWKIHIAVCHILPDT